MRENCKRGENEISIDLYLSTWSWCSLSSMRYCETKQKKKMCYYETTKKRKEKTNEKSEKRTRVEIARCLIFSWRGEFSISTAIDVNCRLYIDSFAKYRLRLCVVCTINEPIGQIWTFNYLNYSRFYQWISDWVII